LPSFVEGNSFQYHATGDITDLTTFMLRLDSFPTEFATYLNYCRSLKFEEKPDYIYLRRLFRDLYIREGYKDDNIFDWTPGQSTNNRNKDNESDEDKEAGSSRRR